MKTAHYLLIIFFYFSPANAIVNVEDKISTTQQQGIVGNVSLSGNGSIGNSETSKIAFKNQTSYLHGNHSETLFLNATYGESRGIKNKDFREIHLRHSSKFKDTLAWEVFSQWSANPFIRLNNRGLVGGGLRWDFSNKTNKNILGTGLFYEYEEINNGGEFNLIRGNLYLSYKSPSKHNLSIKSTTYLQPNLTKLNDFRVLESAKLLFALNKKVSLQFTLEITFDNEPPVSVEKHDINYSTGIKYVF